MFDALIWRAALHWEHWSAGFLAVLNYILLLFKLGHRNK